MRISHTACFKAGAALEILKEEKTTEKRVSEFEVLTNQPGNQKIAAISRSCLIACRGLQKGQWEKRLLAARAMVICKPGEVTAWLNRIKIKFGFNSPMKCLGITGRF